MAERLNLTQELNRVRYADFHTISAKMQELSEQYSDLPTSSILTAFSSVGLGNPYIQNRRVKNISTKAAGYTRDQIEEMLDSPDYNELPLRQVEKHIETSSYPLFHMRHIYQNLLTYHSYIAPYLSNDHDSETDQFWREWKLLEKLRTEMDVRSVAHMITGQALQEGKVFYYPRISIDKSHNKCNYAFMQQLPSDWVKIVGFNNKSKYTLAFNLLYFAQVGTDIRQFGDLFSDYIDDFNDAVYPAPRWQDGKIVYASKSSIDLTRVHDCRVNAYKQNGTWFYWVTLPVDKVFTFEIDDTNRSVYSPFVGLFLDLLQLVTYEKVQLEIVQNPLISILTGEIPYFEDKGINNADQYKLSNAGRSLFEALFYQTLSANNTGGIGFFAAPLQNMKLQSLGEAPSAMEISNNGYSYTVNKAGISGILPTDSDTRSGLAAISLMIESQFAKPIYDGFERMFRCLIEKLNLKYSWKFVMFGDLSADKDEMERARQGMTLGILPDTIRYQALNNQSIFDDISISDAIINSNLMEKRIPLKSTYTDSGNAADPDNEGGRPRSEGINPTSEGQENDEDSMGTTRFL